MHNTVKRKYPALCASSAWKVAMIDAISIQLNSDEAIQNLRYTQPPLYSGSQTMRGSRGGAHSSTHPLICKKSLKLTVKFFLLEKSWILTVNFNVKRWRSAPLSPDSKSTPADN
jgi:hypothetical protein